MPQVNLPANQVGVCSWSLKPESPAELVEKAHACGLDYVQLALDPIRTGAWGEIETINTLRAGDVDVASGMIGFKGEDYSTLESIRATGGIRPDNTWRDNLAAVKDSARLARRLGLGLVTFHAGFIPHHEGPERARMIQRLREVVDIFDDSGVRVAFETGQESAETLLEALDELQRPSAGVNFDPANMILYGMGDPHEALALLAHRVVQLHVKDARPAQRRGDWGDEVRAGTGIVNFRSLLEVMHEHRLGCDLIIEREEGDDRVGDVKAAHEHLIACSDTPKRTGKAKESSASSKRGAASKTSTSRGAGKSAKRRDSKGGRRA